MKTIIAELNRETLRSNIMGVGNVPSNGLRRGVVIDMEETKNNIAESLRQAESMAGVNIRQARVSINGSHIKSQISHGVVAVARADSEISQNDIDRVIDAASVVSIPQNREFLHILPRNFLIDGQERVKNPLGMKGVRLEADVLIIDGLATYINNFAKCFEANNIEVLDFVFTPLALSKSILDKHQKEHGVLSIDLGGGVSTATMFYEGELVHASVIPIGSRHITNDLAIALRTSMPAAEKIKKEFGFIGSRSVAKRDTIDLSEIIGEENFIIPKRNIAEVVRARTAELFDKISGSLKNAPQYLLPAGVVLSGGGANMEGVVSFTKDKMKLAVRVGGGNSLSLEGMADQVSDPSFAVALGLVLWGMEKEEGRGGSLNFVGTDLNSVFKKAVEWMKNFIP